MIRRSASPHLRASALLGAGFAGVVGSIVYGCSLGLDPSKIGATSGDAGLPPASDATSDDVVVAMEAGPDADASDADADAPGCVLDTDCTSASACQVGACDAGTCSFSLCPTQACQGSTCSATTNTCSAPKAYGFHAVEVNVTAGDVACGGDPSVCLAAAYPFVFVGTTNGVVAYAVSDPSNPSPPAVSVLGVPFVPSFITAMGSRVYFVGWPEGSGPGYRLAIASLDVPSDPLVKGLEATTVFEVVSINAIYAAWAATDGSLFLVEDDGTGTFPSADVAPPFVDDATITFFPSPAIPAGGSPVVPSGSRFVIARSQTETTPYQNYFSFETGAGTQGAQNSGEQATFAAIGPTLPQSVYAQGNDGSGLWNAETVVFDDAGNPDVSGVRFSWLVADGGSTQFAQSGFVNPEQYSSPIGYGSPLAGPVAWVDPNTALVLAAAAETINTGTPQTSVQVALMTGPALVSGKRYVVTQTPDQVGAAASGGFGYVLAAPTGGATTSTLHIFAPSCAASP